jgi:hypothetical protein
LGVEGEVVGGSEAMVRFVSMRRGRQVENVTGRYVQSKDAEEDAQAEAPESGVLPDTGRKAGLGVEAGGGSLERWFPDLKEGPRNGVRHEGDAGVDL